MGGSSFALGEERWLVGRRGRKCSLKKTSRKVLDRRGKALDCERWRGRLLGERWCRGNEIQAMGVPGQRHGWPKRN